MNLSSLAPFFSGIQTPGLGPGPRHGVSPLPALNRQLDEWLAASGLADARAELLRASILLWHDHHNAAHGIVQDSETKDGSYIHAILHRREPDYGNAKYWFHRVGKHACFIDLAERAAALLTAKDEAALARKLNPNGTWDALAFVDACDETGHEPDSTARSSLLRELQQIEFEVLVDYLAGQSSAT